MESFPLKKGGNMVWVDVGGGTARNLEFFKVDVIRKYFKAIYILDVSASLLEMAQRRVNAMGLQDIVKVIEHDFTAASVFTVMPSRGSVDVITMSYSFSMIPDKKGAIVNATELLKGKGEGKLAIADFFLEGNYDNCLPPLARRLRGLESAFHKWWFAMDHVHLLGEKELSLGTPALETIWDSRFRGGVPFLPFLQPFHGVYIFEKK
jgi:betaine lipid synthase